MNAADTLFTALYDELHRMARRELSKRGAGVTLGATTLLHDAYLDMSGRDGRGVSRPQPLHGLRRAGDARPDHRLRAQPAGAEARRPVRDHLDSHRRRRGGARTSRSARIERRARRAGRRRRPAGADRRPQVLLRLFVRRDRRHAGVSERTVQRDWEKARIYLHHVLRESAAVDRDVVFRPPVSDLPDRRAEDERNGQRPLAARRVRHLDQALELRARRPRGLAGGAAARRHRDSPPTSRRCSTSIAGSLPSGSSSRRRLTPPRATLAGVSDRRLHARLADRPRRHGQRLAGRAQRRPLRRAGRGQAAERRAGRPRAARSASSAKARSSRGSTHPHIARLIDAGVSGTGQPYLVLEHVDGRHIDPLLRRRARSSVEARIRLFLDVLAAVAHAHANLIVHRDLKPSNVLVTARRPGQAARLRHRQAARRATSRRRPTLTREAGAGADARVRGAGAGAAAAPSRRRPTSTRSACCSTSC